MISKDFQVEVLCGFLDCRFGRHLCMLLDLSHRRPRGILFRFFLQRFSTGVVSLDSSEKYMHSWEMLFILWTLVTLIQFACRAAVSCILIICIDCISSHVSNAQPPCVRGLQFSVHFDHEVFCCRTCLLRKLSSFLNQFRFSLTVISQRKTLNCDYCNSFLAAFSVSTLDPA